MKYRIDLVQTVHEGVTLVVEAEEQDDAEATALMLVERGTDQQGEPIIWEFRDVQEAAEIISSEEWPPVNDPDPPEHDHAA